MNMNPLLKLATYGQSIWLDFIRRGMLDSGEMARLIAEDGIRGVTSNPSIFEKAIAETGDYDDEILSLAEAGKSAEEIYEELAVEDIRTTADLFRPTYDRLDGKDGFVSLEVSPRLAHDTNGTLQEARALWAKVDRPNVMIKIPATREGLPAIRQLISEGINVNVTLLFGLPRYREVADAYLAGLEDGFARKRPMKTVASVASFFLSRIDVLVDPMVEKKASEGGAGSSRAGELRGEVAIASARIAYQMWKEIFSGGRFQRLVEHGARPQRVLWASTSTKNPDYSDVKYVEALIGPETVNTLPLETLHAYRDHGNPQSRLENGLEEARRLLKNLAETGIDLDAVTQQLEDEGVVKFVTPFDRLLKTLEQKRSAVR